jgi:AraC-like DNA-binding protein
MEVEVVKTNVPGIPLRLSRNTRPSSKVGLVSEMHLHDDIEILAGSSGNLEVCVDDEKVNLRVGDIIVINRRVPHSTVTTLPFTNSLMLQFRIEKLHPEEFENINKYLALILSSNGKKYVYLKREDKLTGEIYSIIKNMHEENCAQKKNYEIFVRGYMDVLLSMLYRNGILDNIGESYDKEAIGKVWPVIDFIEKNYSAEITLERLSSTLNMNREYFCRIFKKATGITPTEYINFVRVWKAENLLTTTQNSILEISMEVGFSSVSYFNRVFKKYRGTTPSAYRGIVYAKNKLI